MDKDREDKILEAITRQSGDIRAVVEQNNTIIKKLESHDERFTRVELAVLENSKDIKANTTLIKEVVIKVDKIARSLDTAVTNHEQRIRKVETKIGI